MHWVICQGMFTQTFVFEYWSGPEKYLLNTPSKTSYDPVWVKVKVFWKGCLLMTAAECWAVLHTLCDLQLPLGVPQGREEVQLDARLGAEAVLQVLGLLLHS